MKNLILLMIAIFALNTGRALARQDNIQSKGYKNKPVSEEALKEKGYTWEEHYARVTKYNGSESGSDANTSAGRTSTKVPTRVASVKKNQIGVVAVDPKIVPYGSLMILPNGEKYLAADTGGAVVSKKASRLTARAQKKPSKYAKLPVFDCYSYREPVPEEWATVHVLKNTEGGFTKLSKKEQMKRLDPGYWEEVLGRSI